MFFHFQTPHPEEVNLNREKIELNIDGEPMYLMSHDGGLIINDPTLCKVIPEVEDPVAEVTSSDSTVESTETTIQE